MARSDINPKLTIAGICYWCKHEIFGEAFELPLLSKHKHDKHIYCGSCAELYINGERYVPNE
jgi:hypothetical protein